MTPDELNALADECARQHADYVLLPDTDLPDSGVILLHAAAALRAQAEAVRERDAAQEENTRLRAAMAHSTGACLYCALPKDEWAKCRDGFPGCARMDDTMGCPEIGAAMQLHEVTRERDRLAAWQDAVLDAVQADLEHGVKPLNEAAAKEFQARFPNLCAALACAGGDDAMEDTQ